MFTFVVFYMKVGRAYPEFITSLRWVWRLFVTSRMTMFMFLYSSDIICFRSLAWWLGPNMNIAHFMGPTIHWPLIFSTLYSGSLFIRFNVSCIAIWVYFFISLFLCCASRTPDLFCLMFFWVRSYKSSMKSSRYISFIIVFIRFCSRTTTSCK